MMIIQNIDVTTNWTSVLDLVYEKRAEDIPIPAPQGASIYLSAFEGSPSKIYGIDSLLLETAEEPSLLIDGTAGDRFLSFEVDNLSSVMLRADAGIKLNIIIRTW